MLALTGAVGDGWLPSMEYLPAGPDSIPEANDRIDQAAADAGRSPKAARRLMNFMHANLAPTPRGLLDGPPEAWTDQLADLALTRGISAFLIGGDNPVTAQRFGAEIATAVREIVGRERK